MKLSNLMLQELLTISKLPSGGPPICSRVEYTNGNRGSCT